MKIPLLLLQILTILMALVLLACGSDSGSHADGDIDAGPSDATGPADTSGPTDVTGPAVTVQDITNAILTGLSGDCADYAAVYESMVRDVNRSMNFTGKLSVTVTDDHCVFSSNAIPNHDFNDGDRTFVNTARAQTSTYRVPRSPRVAGSATSLSLEIDNAVFFNGVKLDLLAASEWVTARSGASRWGHPSATIRWRHRPILVPTVTTPTPNRMEHITTMAIPWPCLPTMTRRRRR